MIYKKTNQLINEKSPYLLQHAYNPVDWHAWNDNAFNQAKQKNKPVFLSIGYSTCHWCHVMEHESFEDQEVADILNKYFISIKVDKEERPDIDSIYMSVCQAFTGQGGWPMTIIMTPEQKPFFAGTYFPKNSKYNYIGLIDLLNSIALEWKNDREKLIKSSEDIIKLIKNENKYNDSADNLDEKSIGSAVSLFKSTFDKQYGGFGHSPKFPSPHNFMLLFRYYYFKNDIFALNIAIDSLAHMYRGGIFDHVGGGFSRYSTDNKWLIPHFEKMLYDNALLVISYLEAYQITNNTLYMQIAEKILAYVLRELTDEQGGFYSAQDADSEGIEGKYYVFTPKEILALLGEEDGRYFCSHYNITDKGNFEGKNIPNLINSREIVFDDKIEKLNSKVFDYRKQRTSLHKDDKILTSWNALMIIAFIKAYKITSDAKYINTAGKAIDFIKSKLMSETGKLFVRYRDGDSLGIGNIDDYAFFVWALIEMYEATFDLEFLLSAINVNKIMLNEFFDFENGGFYIYSRNSEQLIHRPKEIYDGAIPSGNSVAAYCLKKLSGITDDNYLEELSLKQLKFMASRTKDYPSGFSFYMIALMSEVFPQKKLICIIKNTDEIPEIIKVICSKFNPNLYISALIETDRNKVYIEFFKDYQLINNQTTFYLCENNVCSNPFNGLKVLFDRL